MKNKTISIVVIVVGAILSIASLILTICSKNKADYGDGIDYSFNRDYVVLMLSGIAGIVFGFLMLLAVKEEKSVIVLAAFGLWVVGLLYSLYGIGKFVKELGKKVEFSNCWMYLLWGIIGIGVFAIGCVLDHLSKKENA